MKTHTNLKQRSINYFNEQIERCKTQDAKQSWREYLEIVEQEDEAWFSRLECLANTIVTGDLAGGRSKAMLNDIWMLKYSEALENDGYEIPCRTILSSFGIFNGKGAK